MSYRRTCLYLVLETQLLCFPMSLLFKPLERTSEFRSVSKVPEFKIFLCNIFVASLLISLIILRSILLFSFTHLEWHLLPSLILLHLFLPWYKVQKFRVEVWYIFFLSISVSCFLIYPRLHLTDWSRVDLHQTFIKQNDNQSSCCLASIKYLVCTLYCSALALCWYMQYWLLQV